MHFLQAINSDLSILIVCNKTGGTIKGDIKIIFEVGRGTELNFSFWEDSSTRETVCFSIINSWQLLVFRVVTAVCCEKYTQIYISTISVCVHKPTLLKML